MQFCRNLEYYGREVRGMPLVDGDETVARNRSAVSAVTRHRLERKSVRITEIVEESNSRTRNSYSQCAEGRSMFSLTEVKFKLVRRESRHNVGDLLVDEKLTRVPFCC